MEEEESVQVATYEGEKKWREDFQEKIVMEFEGNQKKDNVI